MINMGSNEFIELVKDKIVDYYSKELNVTMKREDVYNVWNVKVLQNNKGLFSTSRPDTKYFEATYNGNTEELYLDDYVKVKNICYKVTEEY